MSDRVTVNMDGGIADVRLNRPDKLNALDSAMFDALVETGRRLSRDGSLRAVVLSGEGRAFCAGLDFLSFFGGQGGAVKNLLDRDEGHVANFAQEAAWVWTEVPVPVIAAVHGYCYGGGVQIALAADIRFTHPDAQLSVMEIRWGLIPDMSGSQTLRHVVGIDVAKELAFTGRIVSGREAHALRLTTHVSETPHDAAMALAREIASKSPDAIRAAKRLFADAYVGSHADGLLREETIQKSIIGKPNQMEAVHAGLQKRPAEYRDPEE